MSRTAGVSAASVKKVERLMAATREAGGFLIMAVNKRAAIFRSDAFKFQMRSLRIQAYHNSFTQPIQFSRSPMFTQRFSPARLFGYVALVLIAASPLTLRAAAPNAGPSATEILQHAESQARAQHKNIMLDFGASWCINCKLYDRMLNDPSIGGILNRHFIFITMNTGERPNDSRHANTPGGIAFENSIGGKGAGWPFLVILSADGKPLVDSNRPDPRSDSGKSNIGYPVAPEEVDWFVTMLRRSTPSFSEHDLDTVHAWLTAQAARLH